MNGVITLVLALGGLALGVQGFLWLRAQTCLAWTQVEWLNLRMEDECEPTTPEPIKKRTRK